jgi:hypothetical protein
MRQAAADTATANIHYPSTVAGRMEQGAWRPDRIDWVCAGLGQLEPRAGLETSLDSWLDFANIAASCSDAIHLIGQQYWMPVEGDRLAGSEVSFPYFTEETQNREERMLLEMVALFMREPHVGSIYIQRHRKTLEVFVLLTISKYDIGVLDNLLDVEYDVREKNPDVFLDFTYPLGGQPHRSDFIHPEALCVFSR